MPQSSDITILGSGFGGTLTGLILNRIGFDVTIIDRGAHPRFAIGESSTPIADRVLHDLATRYDLPSLLPFCKYGTWQRERPEVACGLKRGFSYFHHTAGEVFQPDARHRNELLVTASASDDVSDTHWFRADVDAFFANEASEAGVNLIENTEVIDLQTDDDTWSIRGTNESVEIEIHAKFLIDATGNGMVLPRALGLDGGAGRFRTNSRAIYSHFSDVTPWQDVFESLGGNTSAHPFPCDNAALHHVFDACWMWQLRFDNGITSAGFVVSDDTDRHRTAEDEWSALLNRYPSIATQFDAAKRQASPGCLISTERLQRRANRIVGLNWALLPHTAGFVDPLHSTGIAHTLCGIEELARIFEQCWETADLPDALYDYEDIVTAELDLIDLLVAGCYRALPSFELFTAWSMLYFAAATTCEQQRSDEHRAYLLADDADFRAIVERLYSEMPTVTDDGNPSVTAYCDRLAEAIAPYNTVGLCDPSAGNMYRYTAAPK